MNEQKVVTLHDNCSVCRYCLYRNSPISRTTYLNNLKIIKEGPFTLKHSKGSHYSVAYHQNEELSICNPDSKMYPYNKYNYDINDLESNDSDEEVFVILADTILEKSEENVSQETDDVVENNETNELNNCDEPVRDTEKMIPEEIDESSREEVSVESDNVIGSVYVKTLRNEETQLEPSEGLSKLSEDESEEEEEESDTDTIIIIETTIAITEDSIISVTVTNQVTILEETVDDSSNTEISGENSSDEHMSISDECLSNVSVSNDESIEGEIRSETITEISDGSRDDLSDESRDDLSDGSRDDLSDGSRDDLSDGSRDDLSNGSRDDLSDGSRNDLPDGRRNDLTNGRRNDLSDGSRNDLPDGNGRN